MPIKAIVGGVEKEITRIPVLAHDIETATGTNSVTFNTSSDRLIECDILGNGQQNGTPAPDAPIMPQFVGERTKNLLDTTSPSEYVRTTGAPLTNGGIELSINNASWTAAKYANIPVTANSTYTITIYIDEYSGTSTFMIPCRQINGFGTAIFTDTITLTGKKTHTFTADGSTVWLGVYLNNANKAATATAKIRIMLNEGTLGQDFEPYGYKLPITCAGQTTPIYLGQTQTVRRIKKIVFDGTENWEGSDSNITKYLRITSNYALIKGITTISTHYKGANNVSSGGAISDDSCCFYLSPDNRIVYLKGHEPITVSDFKSYLAAQYAAGTPVTVWYVLAEPETGIVNEPLMKIGDYADTVSSEDAAVTIPTIEGTNTLTVGTTLAPSQTTVTYRGTTTAYKDAWEVRDNQDRLVWYRNDTLTGISSISFKGYGLPLKSETVKGQASQNGTPAPDAPVDVVGCGEKSPNVFPLGVTQRDENNGITIENLGNGIYHVFGTATADAYVIIELQFTTSIPISVGQGGNGTLSFFNSESYEGGSVEFIFVKDGVNIDGWRPTPKNRTHNSYIILGGKLYNGFKIYVAQGITVDFTLSPEITNDGIFPTNYTPYGFYLPITCSGQTTPIYLGQTQTVRKIKKLVLTGEENWQLGSGATPYPYIAKNDMPNVYLANSPLFCTHFINDGTGMIIGNSYALLTNYTGIASDIVTWKTWLQQQYTAGTPVTVWYVLATPTTGIINEPLMKIRDYADEVTVNTAIPTSVGTNTFSVNTTLAPSGCSITGHIKAIS